MAKPVLLARIHELSTAAARINRNGSFCVNVLRQYQVGVADLYAGRCTVRGNDRFAEVQWTAGVTSAPRILNAFVAFECSLLAVQKIGTHNVFFGTVKAVHDEDPASRS